MSVIGYAILGVLLPSVFGVSWVNQLDQRFTFTCPTGQSISRIHSIHNNGAEDRLWEFECRPYTGPTGTCSWSAYVNDFDDLLEFHCANSGFVHGIESYHDNGPEDRRFKFFCCEAAACAPLVNCYDTPYINALDGPMDFTLPDGYVLYGAVSVHDNHHEDRRWELHICPCAESHSGVDVIG